MGDESPLSQISHSGREERLNELLAEYLQLAESHQAPDSQAFIDAHPEFTAELTEFFADRQRFQRLADAFAVPPPSQLANAPTLDTAAPAAARSLADTRMLPDMSRVRYFGDYELLDEIARGGMGVVYRARQVNLKRIVALKMILVGQLANEEEVRRFHAEAQAAARLEHPHIVPIFEIGQHEGQHYFTMAFVDGESLAHRVAREVLPPQEAAEVMLKVARAIAFAHVEGVVHRDLKPANILLDRGGEPHVTDFGLAKRVNSADAATLPQQLTMTGQVLGTPSYMPPEQAAGRSDDIGPAADVYSLGAVLYCLLTGRPPFQAASPLDTLLQVIDQEPISPRALNRTIPSDLETICLKCLEKDPRRRYDSAAALADELDRFLHGDPIRARPIGPVALTWRRAKKHQRLLTSIAAAIVATFVMVVLAVVGWDLYRQQRISQLMLTTDGYPLTAEVLAVDTNEVVQSFTIPTESPVQLWPGDYRLRASGPGMLSDTFLMTLDPKATHQYKIDLKQNQLWTPMRLDQNERFEIVNIGNHADILLYERRFGRCALRRLDGATADSIWELPLGTYAHAPTIIGDRNTHATGDPWKHLSQAWAEAGSHVTANYRPVLIPQTGDLNQDGSNDLVFTWPYRDETPLVAISGSNGTVLWQKTWPGAQRLAILPLCRDVNGDRHADVLVTAFSTTTGQVYCEAVSGVMAETIWQRELAGLPPLALNAIQEQWINGQHRFVFPSTAALVTIQGKEALAFTTGQQACAISLANGEREWPVIDIAAPPLSRPQFADIDGDDSADLLSATLPSNTLPSNTVPGSGTNAQLSAWSFATGQSLWHVNIPVSSSQQRQRELTEGAWPSSDHVWWQLMDLRRDPHSAQNIAIAVPREINGALSIDVFSAANGQLLWNHPLFIHSHSDAYWRQFLVAPDLDGDGISELAVVSTGRVRSEYFDESSSIPQLFVDVLSGRDGHSLTLWEGPKLTLGYDQFQRAQWGQPDKDGVPSLLLTIRHDATMLTYHEEMFIISPASGQQSNRILDVQATTVSDFNGDHLPDIAIHRGTQNGSQLEVHAGASSQVWRRLGDLSPAADFDRDGITDVTELRSSPQPRVLAYSGRDGRPLFRQLVRWPDRGIETKAKTFNNALPLGDFNQDHTPDLLIANESFRWQHSDPNWNRPLTFPLQSRSGRNGLLLWNAAGWPVPDDIRRRNPRQLSISDLQPVCRDLNGDGQTEIACIHRVFWSESQSGFIAQLWLTTYTRDGKLLWTSPLCEAVDVGGAMWEDQFPYELSPDSHDLNGDQVADLVLITPQLNMKASPQDINCDVRALSGKNGAVIGEPYRLRRRAPTYQMPTNRFPIPLVGDLDGDQSFEIVVSDSDYTDVTQPQVQRVVILNGATCQFRSEFTWTHPPGSMQYMPALALWDRAANGRQQIAVRHLSENPSVTQEVIRTVDAAGAEQLQVLGERAWTYNADAMQLQTIDVDRDGRDELLYSTTASIKVIDAKGETVWERPPGNRSLVVDIARFTNSDSPVIIVDDGTHFFGLAARTGDMLWRGDGLSTNQENAQITSTSLLQAAATSQPFRVLARRHDASARLCLPVLEDGTYDIRTTAMAAARPPLPAFHDPRMIRRLPWDYKDGPARQLFFTGCCSLVLVVLPSGYLYYLWRRRQFSLRTWLMMPVVVAIVILFVHFLTTATHLQQATHPVYEAFWSGLIGTALLVFPALVCYGCVRRRWSQAAILLGTSFVVATGVGLMMYANAARLLLPAEEFEWTWLGLFNLWLPATVLTGWIALLVVLGRATIGRWRTRTTDVVQQPSGRWGVLQAMIASGALPTAVAAVLIALFLAYRSQPIPLILCLLCGTIFVVLLVGGIVLLRRAARTATLLWLIVVPAIALAIVAGVIAFLTCDAGVGGIGNEQYELWVRVLRKHYVIGTGPLEQLESSMLAWATVLHLLHVFVGSTVGAVLGAMLRGLVLLLRRKQ